MTVPYTFATAPSPLPLSQLDANFAAVGNSTNTSYNEGGTGAVTRTVQNKLQESVSVFDFMTTAQISDVQAKTLTVDVSTPIQNAINNNDHVYFPPGDYRCDSQIALRANLTLTGAGAGVTRLKKVTTTYGGVLCANSGSTTAQFANITLRDFTVFDDVATLGFSEQQHLLTLHGVDNVLIDRVGFYGFRGDGLLIGEWTDTVRTRLNTNINVTNCLFDGVNKDNRNGISVITGNRITIANNVFQNVTRSNMPGAIDLEPDTSTTSVITNITISGNRFFNVGGTEGAVCVYIASTVSAFQNLTVVGNTFDTCSYGFTVNGSRVTTQSQNISYSGNVMTSVGQGFRLLSATNRGITISGNTFFCSGTSLLGFDDTNTVQDIVVSNNTFHNSTSSSTGALTINSQAKNIVVSSNTFNNWYDNAIKIGTNAGDSISQINIVNNVAQNLRGAAYLVQYSAGTLDGASCVYMNNIGNGSNTSRFWRTDDPGAVTNDTTALSFNSATLPNSFSLGNSMAIINGDTGVPSTGGYQGTLIAVKSLTSKFTYQLYYPANNTVKVGSFYMRKCNNAANSWTAWYEFAGV